MIKIVETMKDDNKREFHCDGESVIKEYMKLKDLIKNINSIKSLVQFCRNNINKHFSNIYINDIHILNFNDEDIQDCIWNKDYILAIFEMDNLLCYMTCDTFNLIEEIDICDLNGNLLYHFIPYNLFYTENYKQYCLM